MQALFPVLSQIQGVDWHGECRYVDAKMQPAPFRLRGGTRYDLQVDGTCTLSSFLTFPNGQTRRVQMQGRRHAENSATLRLDPVESGGPIYMHVAEVPPDTILIQEMERDTGKIVLTASLSLVGQELVQVAHEVDGDSATGMEGHQVWRLQKVQAENGKQDDYQELSVFQ